MSLQRTATVVSSLTAFLLLVMKFIVWIFSGSIAVLSSAIDSLLDLWVSLFNYVAIHNSEKPADAKFNYGRWKIEAFATFFEGLIIIASGGYILYESISKILLQESVTYLWASIWVMSISVLITFALVYFLEYVAKKTDNDVIAADALHYKTDLLSSGGILLWLAVMYFTGLFFIDAGIGILIATYIIWSAFALVKKWFLLLLDVSLPQNLVDEIKNIIESEEKISSYHFLRSRRSWGKYIIDAHLVFSVDMKLITAHSISDKIEENISQLDPNKDWIFNFHFDPYDDSKNEKEKI